MRAVLAVVMALAVAALAALAWKGGEQGPVTPEATPTTTERPTPTPRLVFALPPTPSWVEVPEGQALEWGGIYAVDVMDRTLWHLQPGPHPEPGEAGAWFLTWSPQGEAVVQVAVHEDERYRSALFVGAPGGRFRRFPHNFQLPVGKLAWSPDGRFLAASGSRDEYSGWLQVRDLERGFLRSERSGSAHSWSGDSRFLTVFNYVVGRGLTVWDSATGAMPDISVLDVAWSHSGARLAYIPAPSGWSDQPEAMELRVRDFEADSDLLVVTIPGFPRSPLSWSADDAFLAVSYIEDSATGRVKTYVVDIAKRAATVAISGSVSAGWSSSTDTLLLAGNVCGDIDIFSVEADGSGLRNYTQSRDSDMFPRWSPDGERVAFISYREDEAVLASATIPRGEVAELVSASPATLELLDVDWSPDSRYIVFAYGGGFGWCEGEEPQTTEVEVLP